MFYPVGYQNACLLRSEGGFDPCHPPSPIEFGTTQICKLVFDATAFFDASPLFHPTPTVNMSTGESTIRAVLRQRMCGRDGGPREMRSSTL